MRAAAGRVNMPMHLRRGGWTWPRVIHAALGVALAGLWVTAMVLVIA